MIQKLHKFRGVGGWVKPNLENSRFFELNPPQLLGALVLIARLQILIRGVLKIRNRFINLAPLKQINEKDVWNKAVKKNVKKWTFILMMKYEIVIN